MKSEPGLSKKILVIEDSPEFCNLLAESLNANGFQTLLAENGTQGVAMAKEYLPDLILCDLQMPELDGCATLALLRQNAATRRIPFIFLTGALHEQILGAGWDPGSCDYLLKPFTLSELLRRIRALFQGETLGGGIVPGLTARNFLRRIASA